MKNQIKLFHHQKGRKAVENDNPKVLSLAQDLLKQPLKN